MVFYEFSTSSSVYLNDNIRPHFRFT